MYGVVLHAHLVRGESHNQRNATGEVATLPLRDILETNTIHNSKLLLTPDRKYVAGSKGVFL